MCCSFHLNNECFAGDNEDCDKVGRGDSGITIQQLDPMPINGFAHSHNGKVNGYVPHTINITNNPLAEPHQDKVSVYNRIILHCCKAATDV